MTAASLFLFRDDLRLADNPALRAALETGNPVLLAYIHEPKGSSGRPLGGALKWWLHKSLTALAQSIEKRGSKLHLFSGEPQAVLAKISSVIPLAGVYWNRRYHPAQIEADKTLKAALERQGIAVKSFNATLLREPWDVKSNSTARKSPC